MVMVFNTTFNNNIDKEKLNGLYSEIVNTLIIDDIDKDNVNQIFDVRLGEQLQ
jgi:hypothetical protein